MRMKNKKAQASMMEYIIMTLFLVIIIVAIVVVFLGVQFMSINNEAAQQKSYRSMALLKTLSKTQIFTKDNILTENPVFYDKKLTAALGDDFCIKLQKLFGISWSMDITIVDGMDVVECINGEYVNCNKWVFCNSLGNTITHAITREVPINVYREDIKRTEAALMKVSTYE